jgi:hypothetical protein
MKNWSQFMENQSRFMENGSQFTENQPRPPHPGLIRHRAAGEC